MSAKRPPPRRASRARATPAPVTVMVVDDHPMWRQTLRKVLEDAGIARVVAEASNGEEAIALAQEHQPDVVVMDIHLPGLGGVETTRAVLRVLPATKVLVLSAADDRRYVVDAVRAGASGYLVKTAEPAEVADAIARVHNGELVFPPALAQVVLGELREEEPGRSLRVVLADGSRLFRDGLGKILEDAGVTVLAAVGTTDDLLHATSVEEPDVVVTDVVLRGRSGGAAVAAAVRAAHPRVGVVVLAQTVEPETATSLLSGELGGVGYLLKDRVSDAAELVAALRRVAEGGSVLDPEVASSLVRPEGRRSVLDNLTDREREVLALMAEGRSNQAICERLFMSPKAVEAHSRNIYMKLDLEPVADDHRRVLAVITYLRSQ